jgi:hypothetical protein
MSKISPSKTKSQAIAKGKPLIAGFGERFETVPLGGVGLPA